MVAFNKQKLLVLAPSSKIEELKFQNSEDGDWGWSDGTAWGFESWCPGEPNNFGGYAEDYLATNFCSPGGWNDFTVRVNSTFNSGFICQYQL